MMVTGQGAPSDYGETVSLSVLLLTQAIAPVFTSSRVMNSGSKSSICRSVSMKELTGIALNTPAL